MIPNLMNLSVTSVTETSHLTKRKEERGGTALSLCDGLEEITSVLVTPHYDQHHEMHNYVVNTEVPLLFRYQVICYGTAVVLCLLFQSQ